MSLEFIVEINIVNSGIIAALARAANVPSSSRSQSGREEERNVIRFTMEIPRRLSPPPTCRGNQLRRMNTTWRAQRVGHESATGNRTVERRDVEHSREGGISRVSAASRTDLICRKTGNHRWQISLRLRLWLGLESLSPRLLRSKCCELFARHSICGEWGPVKFATIHERFAKVTKTLTPNKGADWPIFNSE